MFSTFFTKLTIVFRGGNFNYSFHGRIKQKLFAPSTATYKILQRNRLSAYSRNL